MHDAQVIAKVKINKQYRVFMTESRAGAKGTTLLLFS